MKSTIDKKKINKNFIKNHEEEVQILVKEPPSDFDYENFNKKNEQKLIEYQQQNIRNKPVNFGTIPNFNKTDTRRPEKESMEP